MNSFIICRKRAEITIVITLAGLTRVSCELISSILNLCLGFLNAINLFALHTYRLFSSGGWGERKYVLERIFCVILIPP